MKLIVAYIKPERLNLVKQALYDNNIFKMSVTNALGCGEEHGYHEDYRGAGFEVNLLKKVRLELAINEVYMEKAIAAIIEGAHTDKVGDGKIFVTTLDEVVRIRTGERGDTAIG